MFYFFSYCSDRFRSFITRAEHVILATMQVLEDPRSTKASIGSILNLKEAVSVDLRNIHVGMHEIASFNHKLHSIGITEIDIPNGVKDQAEGAQLQKKSNRGLLPRATKFLEKGAKTHNKEPIGDARQDDESEKKDRSQKRYCQFFNSRTPSVMNHHEEVNNLVHREISIGR
uniref:WASH_WAHD domain-containing protein n=1 Tax=Caenorhabditis tropicalis TaxID=1561998 RepID=A0A1I7U2T3_9PELO